MDIADVSEAAPPIAAVALNRKHKTTNKVWSEILPQNLKNRMIKNKQTNRWIDGHVDSQINTIFILKNCLNFG